MGKHVKENYEIVPSENRRCMFIKCLFAALEWKLEKLWFVLPVLDGRYLSIEHV